MSFLTIAAAPIQLTEISYLFWQRQPKHGLSLLIYQNYLLIIMVVSSYILHNYLNENEVLLYSTMTSALIVLEKPIYDKIFVSSDFSDTEIINELHKMGFLVDSHEYELNVLDNIYKNEVDYRMPVIKIFSTNKCNAKCYYCFEEGISQIDMTQDVAEQTTRFIIENYPKKHIQINWFGGEPLLNFDIIEMITLRLIEAGFVLKTHVTTNGSLITQKKINFFKKYYETVSIQVTIDEIGEQYGRIKRYIDISKEDAFAKVVNNVHLLLKSGGISTRIRINFLKKNINQGMSVFDYLKEEFKYDSQIVIYLAPLTFDENKPYDVVTEHTHLKLMQFYNSRGVVFDDKDKEKSILSSLSLKPKAIPCGACRTKNLTITADGHIYKCHRIAKYEKFCIGNVWSGINNDNPCMDFFNNRSTESNSEECRLCKVYPICRGGCKVVIDILHQKHKTCDIYTNHGELIKMLYEVLNNKN